MLLAATHKTSLLERAEPHRRPLLSPCDEQAAQGKHRIQEGQYWRNRARLSDAGREGSATAVGTWLPCAKARGGTSPRGKRLNSQHRRPAPAAEAPQLPQLSPAQHRCGGNGTVPPPAGRAQHQRVGDRALRDTHTMALTPRQYRSHMLRNRGWPPMSQSCEGTRQHYPPRTDHDPPVLTVTVPPTATRPEHPACIKAPSPPLQLKPNEEAPNSIKEGDMSGRAAGGS